jgi:hypothetical protein
MTHFLGSCISNKRKITEREKRNKKQKTMHTASSTNISLLKQLQKEKKEYLNENDRNSASDSDYENTVYEGNDDTYGEQAKSDSNRYHLPYCSIYLSLTIYLLVLKTTREAIAIEGRQISRLKQCLIGIIGSDERLE